MRERARDVLEPEPPDQRPPAPGGLRVGAPHAAGEQHVALAGELGEQVEELEHEADVPPADRGEPPLARARHALARDVDDARLRPVEPAEHVQQRRLARARAAEHGDDLARLDREGGAVEHAARGAALAERAHQSLCRHNGHLRKVRTRP